MAEEHPPSPKRGDESLSFGRLRVKPAMRTKGYVFLLFDFNVKHRRVVVFAERLVGIVLPWFVVVLEED